MNPVWVWVAVALVAAAVEALTVAFGFIFASAAALVSAVVAALGAPLYMQLAAFSVSLLLFMYFVRPLVRPRSNKSELDKSRLTAQIGQRAVVVEAIDTLNGTGRVMLDGIDWAAKCPSPIDVGAVVVVTGGQGATLEVELPKGDS